MTEDQNKRYGSATLDMLIGDTGGHPDRWRRGASQMIALQAEKLSELERKVESLLADKHPPPTNTPHILEKGYERMD